MTSTLLLEKLKLSNLFRPTAKPRTVICWSAINLGCLRSAALAAMLLVSPMFIDGCKSRKPANPTPDIKAARQFWVRVLLLDNVQQCSVAIDSKYSIEEANNDSIKNVKIDKKALREPASVLIKDGQIYIAGRTCKSRQITISPESPYIFSLNEKLYRGKLMFMINHDSGSFDVINLVPLESYIAGVAGAEMPDYWEPEALKCQVIAARTYCLFIKKRFGANRAWDLNKTAAHQVYLGLEAESPAVWKAVNDTFGEVLTCKQADGTEDIFPSYYSSTCGGHTENSEEVFGDSYEPLKGVECSYCKDVAKSEIFFWPDAEFQKADVIERLLNRYPNLNKLGEITEISVARQSEYTDFSRLTKIEISDANGNSDFLRAEDFRLTIDPSGRKVKSTACKLEETDGKLIFTDGRGWGHGVGMCQCGAEGMAREGNNAEEILEHYYPGSKILKIEYYR